MRVEICGLPVEFSGDTSPRIPWVSTCCAAVAMCLAILAKLSRGYIDPVNGSLLSVKALLPMMSGNRPGPIVNEQSASCLADSPEPRGLAGMFSGELTTKQYVHRIFARSQ